MALYTRRDWMELVALALAAPRLARAEVPKAMRGAFIILSTPYQETKALDYDDLAREVEFLDRSGVQGLVWPQNSSEQGYLTKDERLGGMEVLAQAARARRPALIFGVQGEDTTAMLEYARAAERLEADGVIAIPPTKAQSISDYRSYFTALCETTSRPVFIQTSGGARGVEPTVEFIVEMAERFPHFGYVKEEHEPVVARMLALATHRPRVIKSIFGAAFGRAWKYEMRLGMDGVMTGGAMYADIYARLWQLHVDGRHDEVRDLFAKLLLMLNLDEVIPGVRLYMLKKRGIFKTMVSRRGSSSLSREAIDEIEHNWKALEADLRI